MTIQNNLKNDCVYVFVCIYFFLGLDFFLLETTMRMPLILILLVSHCLGRRKNETENENDVIRL